MLLSDLDKHDQKPYFDIEVRDSNCVVDAYTKLTEISKLSGLNCFLNFTEADDKIEDGASVFAVVKSH